MIKIEIKERNNFNIVNTETIYFKSENAKIMFINEIQVNFNQNRKILKIDSIIN